MYKRQQLVSAAYPAFRADAAYPTATAIVEALRTHNAAPQQDIAQPIAQPAPEPVQQVVPHSDTPQKKSSSSLLLGLGAGAAALVIIAGLAWFFTGRAAWSEEEQALVDAHPALLSPRPGGSGVEDTTCESREPEESQTAKITCSGDGVTYSVAGYAGTAERDAAGPAQGAQELSNGRCSVRSYDVSDEEPLFYICLLYTSPSPRD